MVIQATRSAANPLCLTEIATEFGGTANHCLTEYYRGGVNVPNTWINRNVPASGNICLSDFESSSNAGVTITPDRTSVDEDGTNNTVTFTIDNFNINGGSVNYTITGVSAMPITFADFVSISLNGGAATNITSAADLTGTVNLTNGTGTITLVTREDFLLEGAEQFNVTVTDGTLSATSANVTVNDTSFGSIVVTDDQTDDAINLAEEVCFTATITGLADGNYPYTITPITGTVTYAAPTVAIAGLASAVFTNANDPFTLNITNAATTTVTVTGVGSVTGTGTSWTFQPGGTAGTATITATSFDSAGNASTPAVQTVTVEANPTVSISGVLTPVNVGDTDAFTVTRSAGATGTATSSNTGVLTIASATSGTPSFTGTGAGTATITATASRTLNGVTRNATNATASVTVNSAGLTVGGNLFNSAFGFRSVFQTGGGIFTDGYTMNAAGQYRNRTGLVQAETTTQNTDVPQITSGNYTGGRPYVLVSVPTGSTDLTVIMTMYDESQWDFTNHDINVAHGTAASFPNAALDFFSDIVITGSGGGTVTIANNAAGWSASAIDPAAADDKDCSPGARQRTITVTRPGSFGATAASYVFNGYT